MKPKHRPPDNCPLCGAIWLGDEIPPDLRHHYGSRTHFRRTIGIYDLLRDMRVGYSCPDCGTAFDSWTHRPVSAPS